MTTKCIQGIELLKIYHILIGETFNIYRFQKIQPKYNVPCKFYVCKKQTKLPSRIDVKPLLRNEYKLQNVSFFQRLANLTQNYPVSHELRQSMTLLMPKSWSSTNGKCNKALPPNKEQPKNKSGFKMPWSKKESKQSTTNMQKLPSPKKQTPKPKSKERSSMGARMKSFVVRFIGKSIITGAVLYATLYYRVWGSIDDSVLLYNKIMTCVCKGNYGDSKSRESFDSEPINSSELRDYVVRKYNSNVQWIVCKSIGLPDLAFCYINYYSWLLVDYAKQIYTQVRGDDDD